jgi:hypothetical protein
MTLVGQRFDRLTVTGRTGANRSRAVEWSCLCDCGNMTTATTGNLRAGHNKSCGCLRRENAYAGALHRRTHRMSGSPTYNSWMAMKHRCLRKTASNFARYGGRGVTVCNRWMSFESFLSDMGVRPEGKTLDRIDPLGNYEPGNCRWATPMEQAHNKREVSK